jgi:transposase InsO family protein
VLRSDRGTKYNLKEFAKLCEEKGVERELAVEYAPKQNGV